ncbi:MAG TPA: NUDIX hydrolase [bacterium]|nr:NUDIX hydrolase [bacterium]
MKKLHNPQNINLTKASEIGIFKTMIASGAVIIQKNAGKLQTLLVKHGDKPLKKLRWKFCGGKLLKGWNLKENALREAKEEIGVKVKIIGELPTLALWQEKPETGQEQPELILLIHYLATINQKLRPGKEILAMQWFDINHLPKDCSPNIKPTIAAYKKLYH